MRVISLINARYVRHFGYIAGIFALICGSLLCCSHYVSPLQSQSPVADSANPGTQVVTAEKPVDDRTQYQHSFGIVSPNTVLNHEFSIVNDSDHPWVIRQIKTSCRCVAAQPAKSTILPSERLVLPVSLKIGNDSGNTLHQFIEMKCDDSKDDRRFDMTASVKGPVTVLPARCEVSLTRDDVAIRSLVIENYSDRDWTDVIVSPRTRRDGASCLAVTEVKREHSSEVKGSEGARQVWTATVRIGTQGIPDGRYEKLVDVVAHLANGESDATVATYFVEVRPDIRIVPASLVFLPNVPASDELTKEAVLKYAAKDSAPNSSEIKFSHDLPIDVDVRFAPLANDATKVTIVIGSLPKLLKTVRGAIKIVVPPPLNRQLTVPVTILGRPEG